MTALTHITIAEARTAMAKGEFSSQELTQAYLDAIGAANPSINA